MLLEMRSATKMTKTLSLDRKVLDQVKRTKGQLSESERVNSLLRVALDLEMKAALDREAAQFFASDSKDRDECRAFQSASIASLARD